jgi:hypothetical protein
VTTAATDTVFGALRPVGPAGLGATIWGTLDDDGDTLCFGCSLKSLGNLVVEASWRISRAGWSGRDGQRQNGGRD